MTAPTSIHESTGESTCPDCGRKTYRVKHGGHVVYEHADTGSVYCPGAMRR